MKHKKCSKCSEIFPATLEYFYSNKARKDGLQTYCIECVKKYNHSEKSKLTQKKFWKSERGRLNMARQCAKKRGLGDNLKFPNILAESYHLHHINSKEIVAVPAYFHNFYKINLTLEQHIFMLNQIINQIYGDFK